MARSEPGAGSDRVNRESHAASPGERTRSLLLPVLTSLPKRRINAGKDDDWSLDADLIAVLGVGILHPVAKNQTSRATIQNPQRQIRRQPLSQPALVSKPGEKCAAL